MNVIADKSYSFAIDVVRVYKIITSVRKEYVLSKQILRSGTAIGALIKESEHAQSKADFLNKMNIALKEANETTYWLLLLKDTSFISIDEFQRLDGSCKEILRLLISIVKTTKVNLGRV